jgi:hypothetical protein
MKSFYLLLLLVSVTFSQIYIMPESTKEEKTCAICGRYIINYVEKRNNQFYDYDDTIAWKPNFSFNYTPDSSKVYYLKYSADYIICRICYDQYKIQFQKQMEIKNTELFKWMYDQNVQERKRNESLIKLMKIDKLKERMQDIQDDIDVLLGKTVSKPNYLYYQGKKILCDSLVHWGTISSGCVTSNTDSITIENKEGDIVKIK